MKRKIMSKLICSVLVLNFVILGLVANLGVAAVDDWWLQELKVELVKEKCVQLTVVVGGEGIGNLSYTFSWLDSEGCCGTIAENTKEKSVTWSFEKDKIYYFSVAVVDDKGQRDEALIECNTASLWNLKGVDLDKPFGHVGEELSLKASVLGNKKDLKYTFSWKNLVNREQCTISEKSTGDSVVWTPSKPGNYLISVKVEDNSGKSSDTGVVCEVVTKAKYVGIINYGYNCGLSSVLQMLYHSDEIRNAVLSLPVNPAIQPYLAALKAQFEKMDRGELDNLSAFTNGKKDYTMLNYLLCGKEQEATEKKEAGDTFILGRLLDMCKQECRKNDATKDLEGRFENMDPCFFFGVDGQPLVMDAVIQDVLTGKDGTPETLVLQPDVSVIKSFDYERHSKVDFDRESKYMLSGALMWNGGHFYYLTKDCSTDTWYKLDDSRVNVIKDLNIIKGELKKFINGVPSAIYLVYKLVK